MKQKLILLGGGGHCISCIDVIRAEDKFSILGILDTAEKKGSTVSGVEIIGTDENISDLFVECRNFLITVGQIKSPELRISLYTTVNRLGGILPVIISPRAYVSTSAKIGEGTIVMHDSIVNANSVIGKNCIINTNALIEHEATIGDFCHISTHAVVNGQVRVGDRSFIGSNSILVNNITIPDNTIVAAGACVLKSPEIAGTYIGNPARKS